MSPVTAAQERDAKREGNKLLDGFKDAADEFGDGLKNAGDRLTGRTVRRTGADLHCVFWLRCNSMAVQQLVRRLEGHQLAWFL